MLDYFALRDFRLCLFQSLSLSLSLLAFRRATQINSVNQSALLNSSSHARAGFHTLYMNSF
jgi:hypothetical protein